MKNLIITLALMSIGSNSYAHSMGVSIKKYVPERVSSHDVMVMNSHEKHECYNVFVDGKPHFNYKVCLAPKQKQYVKVFVDTPPNKKVETDVCTEDVGNVSKGRRFRLCTKLVTYYPQEQLQSALQ